MTDRGPVVADLARPRLAEPVTLAVIADPHLAVEGRGTWKLRHRSEPRLRTAIETANEADAVVFAGDLTNDGHPAEFDRVDELLADLSVPWTAIPGNHDVAKSFDGHETPPVTDFARRYRGDATRPDAAAYPLVLRVGGLRVVCLNTAAPGDVSTRDTWGGAVGPAQRSRLADLLADEPETPTLVVAHHNLGPLPEHPGGEPWSNFAATDATRVRALLAEAGVPLALTGHQHVPAVEDRDGVTELLAPATCSFPQGMVWLRVAADGTTVRFVPLADRAGTAEAYWYARTGKPLAQGILDATTRRLGE
ncbi:metallophosphoesterase family protein [Halosegnis longus]|uniref:metallophosphoesterase family protein n=1 Tax=Halosegnis longus TaxID=2216012 RepID=UPI00096A88D3|nr:MULTISPECIES: metallophosphoesterase [Halobacteriales]